MTDTSTQTQTTPPPLPEPAPSFSPVVALTQSDQPKAGYMTTEFYVVLLTFVPPIVRAITGHNVSMNIDAWATALSGIVSSVYVIWRTSLKKAHVAAQTSTPDPVV